MSRVAGTDPALVRDRLVRHARESRQDVQYVLTRYANERLLYRIGLSSHAERFVLKGATLFSVWQGEPHRPSRDLDLLGFGTGPTDDLVSPFQEILTVDAGHDGVWFQQDTLTTGPIRETQRYGGTRVKVVARIDTARVTVQVDVGFGDVVVPHPEWAVLPTLLDFPPPRLRTYPRETVVAEKLEAIVSLGLANSRMKDFYDLLVLGRSFEFEGPVLSRAIEATFERRGTVLPADLPFGLSPAFSEDPGKQRQWRAFLAKSRLDTTSSLDDVCRFLASFIGAPIHAIQTGGRFERHWNPPGPWR